MWTKGKTIDDTVVNGVEQGELYKIKRHANSTLMTITIRPCEIWHKKLGHIHYKEFPIVSKVVTGFLEI